MKSWLRAHPWIWLVILFGAMIVANVVMLFIATSHPAVAV